jgi:hypothetical protein
MVAIAVVLVLLLIGLAAAAQTAAGKPAPGPTGKATISGKVTDAATTKGVGGVAVTAYLQSPDSNQPGGFAYTAAASVVTPKGGSYTLEKLTAGTYRVEFVPSASSGYARQTWLGVAALSAGDDIVLAARTERTGVNAALSTGGTISGVVTDGSRQGVGGVTVTAYRQFSADPVWTQLYQYETVATTVTSTSGSYTLTGLPTGEPAVVYHVDFRPAHLETYALEAYDDECAVANGDDVELTPGASATGIDAMLDTPGTLEGTITDAGGIPIQGIHVHICYQTTGIIANLGDVATDADGRYVQHGLKEFPFFPWATDPDGWHLDAMAYPQDDPENPGSPDPSEYVPPGGTKTRDLTLDPAGKVTGRVLDAGLSPVAGVSVSAWSLTDYGGGDFGWDQVSDFAKTGSDGRYIIPALAVGDAYLMFTDPPAWRFARTCYGGATLVSDATPIPIEAHVAATAGDVVLSTQRGSISGTITDGAGDPLSQCDATVRVFDPEDDWSDPSVAVEFSGGDGAYSVDGLPYGVYKVIFNHQSDLPNLTTTYDNDPFDMDPTPVTVGADSATSAGIDGSLPLPSTITGAVTGGGEALQGIQVMVAVDRGGWWNDVAWSETNGDGVYEARVPAGDAYRVRFEDPYGNWVGEWYPSDVAVGPQSTKSGIDADLARAAHITGHVTIPEGAGYGLGDVWISAVAIVGGEYTPPDYGGVQPDENGDFDVGGIPVGGDYVLKFENWNGHDGDGNGYLFEFFDDTLDWASAQATKIYVDENGQWLASDHSQQVTIDAVVDEL